MKVVAADWLPYCLPLRRPWQTSRGTLNERHGRLRRLVTEDGRTGWGDCAPLPEFGIDEAAATAFAEESATLDLAAQAAGLSLGRMVVGRFARYVLSRSTTPRFGGNFRGDTGSRPEFADGRLSRPQDQGRRAARWRKKSNV